VAPSTNSPLDLLREGSHNYLTRRKEMLGSRLAMRRPADGALVLGARMQAGSADSFDEQGGCP
jgi:hypothetical protein